MDIQLAIILALVGFFAGIINIAAGGGSLITLPVFIFLGFDSTMANATNRVAILTQNMAAIQGFRRNGVFDFRYSLRLGSIALLGAGIGAWMAMHIPDGAFNKILAIIMLVVSALIIFDPGARSGERLENMSKGRAWVATIVFFFIGIYGGFIQAGTGFLVIAALSLIHHMNLVKINSIKVFVVFSFTIVALSIFAFNGLVDWKYGLALAIGQTAGGWVGSQFVVKKGDKWVRSILMVMITLMALKLLGVPFLNP